MNAPGIPPEVDECELVVEGRAVNLTNLNKVFWPEERITKRDLLLYYASISEAIIPHLRNRAMVMKRYPNGITGDFFFMKRTPGHRPGWIETCSIEHRSGNVIDFPIAQNTATLLWLVNLGCIDMNQWYATCDDINKPDYLHFDLDPVPPATLDNVCQAALELKSFFDQKSVATYPKTTGSRGIHVYIPIVRGPLQKQVWTVAKKLAGTLAKNCPALITNVYRVADRPPNRVLVDYNQNAWGRTLASVYSVRAKPKAPVSMPLHWHEVESGIEMEDFTLANASLRLATHGDLFLPLLQGPRYPLESLL